MMILRSILIFLGLSLPLHAASNGAQLYEQHCALCHGVQGTGIPGVFPPLANADFLKSHREKSLRAPLEGLSEKITVNGVAYHGAMPPVLLGDEDLAAVFSYVFSSWGNQLPAPSVEEIRSLRAKTKHPTLDSLQASMVGQQLPTPPEGWDLRVAAELSFSPVRLAMHANGRQVLALSRQGDIWLWNPDQTHLTRLIEASSYLDPSLGSPSSMGLTVDREGRLYVTCNQRNEKTNPVSNEVTIFRSEPWSKEDDRSWQKFTPWLRASYPFGIGPYNHGLSHIAQGPDGMMYVTSGARTDGGESGDLPNYDQSGEHHLTATLWRLNPDETPPRIEIFARGLRNSYGFCWDNRGRLFATENGPDADPPEELNLIEEGRHYGFPYQYADWTNKPYPHSPDLPAGIEVTQPIRNSTDSLSTFEAHSCPSGIIWLDHTWPKPFADTLLTARFGNLLKREKDVGFDVVHIQPNESSNRSAKVTTLLAPLGRPIDLLVLPGHQILIAEYCRGVTFAAGIGTPGRLLILRPKSK
ncbi:c-type cytochrome [Phragmitibacter flavus]|uniref:C-type cytochrome n=1 Tax=Phragmitibacter flavus TaxID=2576071 RepID=A0A5R8KHL9_9BACT|nr:PQQ-dependent sugar dehydrogenase [Phragmitibacter flavus]TLD71808.1 c-type cytochrome [Phragmitibacter flavus]